MKYNKARTLRAQQAVARFGKHAQHRLCLAALDLWQFDEETFKPLEKNIESKEELLKTAQEQLKQARALIDQLRKEKRNNDANTLARRVRETNKEFLKELRSYNAAHKLSMYYCQLRGRLVAEIEIAWNAAASMKDYRAKRALQRLRKRWNDKQKAWVNDRDRRTLEILKILRDELIKKARSQNGMVGFYLEAARSGHRPLSDDALQGLLTPREIQYRLSDAPADVREIRRLMKRLGIQPAKDKRGRKQKPYRPKLKRPRAHEKFCRKCRAPLRPHERLCDNCISGKPLLLVGKRAASGEIGKEIDLDTLSHHLGIS